MQHLPMALERVCAHVLGAGDSPLRDRFLPSPSRTRRPRDACCTCCSGEAACYRYVKFCKFCCVVTGSLFFVVVRVMYYVAQQHMQL